MPNQRQVDHPVNPLFVNRWSPRAFTGEPIDDATLFQFFEAARWAPSAYNAQPWRFIYVKNDSKQWDTFVNFLSEFNQSWAKTASALVIVLAKTSFIPPGKTEPIQTGSHTFDAGAAWGSLALQASHDGWHTHAIGGYNKLKVREALQIPDEYTLEIVVAIGKQAKKSVLSDELREREVASSRLPVSQLISEGQFNFKE
ncbi:MAG TPA: nitroreductase family protein [Methylophilaceae bacterium]|nr:nitroreductase family protein [Methylophilaceae bacterium]HQC29977.1 nitroreductase family protein [Methylotenera sp.]